MSLRGRWSLHAAGLLLAVALLGAAGVVSVWVTRADYSAAKAAQAELRMLYEAGAHARAAEGLLLSGPASRPAAVRELQAARDRLKLADPPADEALLASFTAAADRAEAARSAYQAREALAATRAAVVHVARAGDEVRRRLGAAERSAEASWRQSLLLMALAGMLASGVVAGVLVRQYGQVAGPVRRLHEAVRRFAGGEQSARVAASRDLAATAEFARLAADFNAMADELCRLQASLEQNLATRTEQLVDSQRLAGLGFLAAGLAHEINNPLAAMAGHAELAERKLLRGEVDPAGTRHALAVVREEAARVKALTGMLLDLARPAARVLERVDVVEVANAVHWLVKGLPISAKRRVVVEVGPDVPRVQGRPEELRQALLNLLLNACHATRPGGQVMLGVRARPGPDGQGAGVLLEVTDDGRGMTPEVLDHAFDPFFSARRPQSEAGTDDPAPRGTGLGLTVTHAIVTRHGGQIRAASPGPGRGSCVTIWLPAAGVEVASQEGVEHATAP
ncbi:MAG: sensor histidine kinase [Phycisphaerae bacterium]